MSVYRRSEHEAETIKPGVERRVCHEGELMFAVIDFSGGPWEEAEAPHCHPHVQVSYLASGEIIFYCEGEPEEHLKPGDVFLVPSGKNHCIKLLTETARLVDGFNPLREDFLK